MLIKRQKIEGNGMRGILIKMAKKSFVKYMEEVIKQENELNVKKCKHNWKFDKNYGESFCTKCKLWRHQVEGF